MFKINRELVLYIFFGLLTVIVNWMAYIFFINIIQMPLMSSNALAWLIAVIFAYITNRMFVFKSQVNYKLGIIAEFCMFFSSRVVTGLFDVLLPSMLIYLGINQKLVGIEGFYAKGITSVVVIVLNYVFSKLLIFKDTIERKTI